MRSIILACSGLSPLKDLCLRPAIAEALNHSARLWKPVAGRPAASAGCFARILNAILQKSLCLARVLWNRQSGPAKILPVRMCSTEEHAVRLRRVLCLMALAAGLAACSRETDYTPEQRSCIAQHYANYDARQLNQCVDVCRLCMRGNVLTCNTSCRLRGAKPPAEP